MNKLSVVLVSVGTTQFDGLMKVFDNADVQEKLLSLGTKKIIVQYGSSPQPSCKVPGLVIESFSRTNDMTPYLEQSTVMVSHAGAGCILDAREHKIPHCIVVNDSLMNNHQEEIANKIATECTGAVFYKPGDLVDSILSGSFLLKLAEIRDFKSPSSKNINDLLDELLQ